MASKKGNQVFSIVFAVIWGVITGVLWAYANPIQLVPGIIQWRIFAFLPPVIGILFGPISGFISGYLGSVVWGLLAGTFIPAHTLLVDGIMVGVTGLVPALTTGRKFTLEQMATSGRAMVDATVTAGITTVVMVFAVCASLAVLGIFPFWWAVLWIGLSDIIPVLIGTPLVTRYGARVLQSATWLPTQRI
ncbi:MAG: aminotriazole resistance protein [Oscillatoriophycideae cyanobacterium NC_groundwater_1537_Pr4_S-0.65um_50_18]|nr:aminotriazole resistance protein [Oscillatoriophycideae cyanobacterium NC_groundwater_1537_Pr4_S-0.65um_50_18]